MCYSNKYNKARKKKVPELSLKMKIDIEIVIEDESSKTFKRMMHEFGWAF